MKRKKTKRKRQGGKVAKAIDTIETATSAAIKIYRAVELIAKAFLANGKKAK
jgi:hypothetical protein